MEPAPLLRAAVTDRLALAGCVAPGEETAELAAAAPDAATLEAWTVRREEGEPLAWITGRTRFCGLDLVVRPGVYVPRPQSEELAREAAALLPGRGAAADLCTGTGAIAAHLRTARPDAAVVATDLDPVAARCAAANGVPAVVADLGSCCRARAFDVVVAVTPYVPTGALRLLPADVQRYEPRRALDGGADGLDLLRRLVEDAARLLRPGGWLLTEIGGDQDQSLEPVLDRFGFGPPSTWHDDEGDLRGVRAQVR